MGQKNIKASDRIKFPNGGFKQAFSAYTAHGKTPHRGLIYFKKKQSGSQGESTTMWWVRTVYGYDNFLPTY
jgi:hypothetical protein